MPSSQLFVGSTNRLYFAGAYTVDPAGNQAEFSGSVGEITAQILGLDGAEITPATPMAYTAGQAIVNGQPYESGNWSVTIASDTPLVAGKKYLVEYVGTITPNAKPDLTERHPVIAQIATA